MSESDTCDEALRMSFLGSRSPEAYCFLSYPGMKTSLDKPARILEIYQVAHFHIECACDTTQHAYAYIAFSLLDTRNIGFSHRASNHEGKLVLRQLLHFPLLAYFRTK